MIVRRLAAVVAVLSISSFGAETSPGPGDTVLRAMQDELTRSMSLKLAGLGQPYFVEYAVDDSHIYQATATLGGLISATETPVRIPRVSVRVGSQTFDNTNYIRTNAFGGSRYDVGRFPLENDYGALRRFLWLATDQTYKSSIEAISRKKAALRNISVVEPIPDFGNAPVVKEVDPVAVTPLRLDDWKNHVRKVSAEFEAFPALRGSAVEFIGMSGTHRYANTEGSVVRLPQSIGAVRIRAAAQSNDGMTVRDAALIYTLDPTHLPSEVELSRAAQEVGKNASQLATAPYGEDYTGPVLFESVAGAQVFAEVIGRNLALTRKPVADRGFSGALPYSELEGRQGARILPESFDIVDDATQKQWHGQSLFGWYAVDEEGVKPVPVTVVEKGVLKSFLMTRTPMRTVSGSNGHARLPGQFGGYTASPSNLFVRSRETVSLAELKRKLIETCQQRGKPYGLIVRKMDFPSAASLEEVRRILSGAGQGARPVSLPLLTYRVYPDGREELIRGVRLRGFNARSFKDIMAAGNDENLLNYEESNIPFAFVGAGGSTAETSVIAPSVLIDDLEVQKIEEELPKLPVVPPPALVSSISR